MHISLKFIFCCLLANQHIEGAIFSWMFKSYEDDHSHSHNSADQIQEKEFDGDVEISEHALEVKIPFEISKPQEKFLSEAVAYSSLKLTELDFCHHRVILGLKTSCNNMSQEDISKVAVNLLNCQSKAENRRIYPCTDFMTISECTKNMDSNTWATYHIISNRAQAVCYATRQQQFTAKTEMAVNKLMLSTENQIDTIKTLQEGQQVLGEETTKTIKSLTDGHQQLKDQQRILSSSNAAIHSYVATNLRELAREKSLIASGQKELVQMTLAIKGKLEQFKEQLSQQESGQKTVHDAILDDLAKIQDNAMKVWKKFDEETERKYGHLRQDLQKMNNTVHQAIKLIEKVETNIIWISQMAGTTDTTMQKVYTCITHGSFIFLAMLAGSFLQVPALSRIAILFLTPLNAITEMRHQFSLDMSTLALVIVIFVVAEVVIRKIILSFKKQDLNQTFLFNQSCMGELMNQTCNLNSSCVHVDKSMKLIPNETLNTSIRSTFNVSKSNADYSSDEDSKQVEESINESNNGVRQRFTPFINEDFLKPDLSNDSSMLNESKCEIISGVPLLPDVKKVSEVKRHLFNDSIDFDMKASRSFNRSRSNTPTRSARKKNLSQSLTPKKLCGALCKNGQPCRNAANSTSEFCFKHGGESREGTPLRF